MNLSDFMIGWARNPMGFIKPGKDTRRQGNVYVAEGGATLYDYGDWYPLCHFDAAKNVFLINTAGWSNTTGKHISQMWRALNRAGRRAVLEFHYQGSRYSTNSVDYKAEVIALLAKKLEDSLSGLAYGGSCGIQSSSVLSQAISLKASKDPIRYVLVEAFSEEGLEATLDYLDLSYEGLLGLILKGKSADPEDLLSVIIPSEKTNHRLNKVLTFLLRDDVSALDEVRQTTLIKFYKMLAKNGTEEMAVWLAPRDEGRALRELCS